MVSAGVGGSVVLTLLASLSFGSSEPLLAGEACLEAEPGGYRMSNFLAPVPCTLAGAEVLSTERLRALVARESTLLVDVLPSPRRPQGLPDGAIWQPHVRRNIPGSAWLPNTGFGVLPLEEESYLRQNLERLTGGDKAHRLVIYCKANCWMSWNVARRAVSWGYTAVSWYPCGTDGWEASGLPLTVSVPVPFR